MHQLVTNEAPSGLLTLNFNDPGHTHSINGSTGVMSYTGGSGQYSSGGNEGPQGWKTATCAGSPPSAAVALITTSPASASFRLDRSGVPAQGRLSTFPRAGEAGGIWSDICRFFESAI